MAADCVSRAFLAIGHWIYDFQTLLTGFLAVGAAWYAAKFAQRQVNAAKAQIDVGRDQIAAAREQANRERAAKLRAARASLPTTLSAVCEYAQSAAKALYEGWPTAAKLYPNEDDIAEVHTITVTMPTFPPELSSSLERVIEFTDAEDVAERIESIFREAQVLAARTQRFSSGAQISTDELATHIVQAAALYARAESLFTYARRKSEGVNTADLWGRVFAALAVMQIHHPVVRRKASSQKDAGQLPGEADSIEPT